MRSMLLSICLLLSAYVAAADPPSGSTAFMLAGPGGIVVQVTVNGQGPFRFLLDTGSTHSSITESLAARVGARLVAQAMVGSVLGSTLRPIARLDRLTVGPVRVDGLMPSVVPDLGVLTAEDVAGVLGQDVLATWRYTIDFRERRLRWLAAPLLAEDGRVLQLEADQGRFVVRVPHGAMALRLVPDSGASSLLLVRTEGRCLPSMSISPDPVELSTLSARASVHRAVVHELRIGAATLRDLPALIVDAAVGSAGSADGLLPLHLFDRVTFDGPRGLLIVEGTGA